jgi:hypothetical protein
MKTLIAIALLALSTNAVSGENEDYFKQVFSAAKVASACQVIAQISAFQEEKKMPGGHAFVAEFMRSELARMNLDSIEEWVDVCARAREIKAAAVEALVGVE